MAIAEYRTATPAPQDRAQKQATAAGDLQSPAI
jgi:hypothetical protein